MSTGDKLVNEQIQKLCDELDSSQIGHPQKIQALQAIVRDGTPGTDISPLIGLCTSRKEQVRNIAIKIVKLAPDHFKAEIQKAAYDALRRTTKSDNPRNELSRKSLFYQFFDFPSCFVQYLIPYFSDCSQAMKQDVLSQLTQLLQSQKIDATTVKQALTVSFATDLTVFVVTQQSLIAPLDEDLTTALNEEFEKSKDTRLLIPTIPGMKGAEFLQKFDLFMELPETLLRTFAFEFLHGKPRPIEISEFLVELHKYENKEDVKFQNAIKLFSFMVDNKQVVTMRDLCTALDRVARLFSIEMIFANINKVLAVHPDAEKLIAKRMVPDIIERNVCTSVELWTQMKRLLNDTNPTSLPVMFKLNEEQFEDLLKSYPDLKDDLIEYVKTHANDEFPEKHKKILGFE